MAFNDVLNDAIAFAPTADEDGERIMEQLSAEEPEASDSTGSIEPSGAGASRL